MIYNRLIGLKYRLLGSCRGFFWHVYKRTRCMACGKRIWLGCPTPCDNDGVNHHAECCEQMSNLWEKGLVP